MRNRFSRWIRQACCLLAAAAMTAGLSAGAAEEVYKLPIDLSGGMKYDAEASWSKDQNLYEDPTIRAEFHEFRENRINPADGLEHGVYFCYVDVTIQDASQLRTAAGDAKDFTRGIMKRTLDIARRVQAVVAVDGDFCNSYYGEEANKYCLRQGVVYRDTVVDYLDMLLIDEDGDFHIVLAEEHPEEMDKTAVNGKKITNALCFGPALIRDGEIVVDPSKAQEQSHPIAKEIRMAICQMGEREYMLVTNSNESLTLEEFAQFLSGFDGIQQAYNLDGGMSSHLVFMGELRNKFALINNQDYRPVPDIIYFASAYRPD